MNLKSDTHISRHNHDGSLDELREIILGLNVEELQKLHSWVKDKNSFTEDIAHILPSAVLKSIEQDEPLGDTLTPIIEEAIFNSVHNNPQALANALFPIMGPAIRKSISETFRSLIESLNQTLEKKFSPDRIKWRMEAMFSSKSYAEIVLLKGISFKVKHVFLIHKETGLLIQNYHTDSEDFDTADMVSSMLTAVQDFVKDSFAGQLQEGDTLDTIKLNDLNVWIENGPFASLAVVFDGTSPESNRQVYKVMLEKIHQKYSHLLKSFDGDSDQFEMLIPYLKSCAIQQEKVKTSFKKPLAIFVIILLLFSIWMGFTTRDRMRWNSFIDELNDAPGVVILQSERGAKLSSIRGMKDVLSSNFGELAYKHKLDSSKIVFRWVNYISLDTNFSVARLKSLLPINTQVQISFHNQTLFIKGEAESQWIEVLKKQLQLPYFTGLNFDLSELKDRGQTVKISIFEKIESLTMKFDRGSYHINRENQSVLDSVAQLFASFQAKKPQTQLLLRIYPDNTDDKSVNMEISRYRLSSATKYLVKKGILKGHIQGQISEELGQGAPRELKFQIISDD
jgi:OOP family OmpA-OmpF porin